MQVDMILPSLVLLILPLTATNNFDITPINSQILPFHLGSGRIIDNEHIFIHFINTDTLAELLDDIIKNFNNLNDTFNKSTTKTSTLYKNILENLLIQTDHIIAEAQTKLSNIRPNIRNKRGLFDFVVKTSKFLFGTLDSEDGEKFNKAINTLLANQNSLNKQAELQISLSKHLIENYNNPVTKLSKNQQLIADSLNKFQDKVHKTFEDLAAFTRIQNIIEQILLNSQSLIRFLDNIENAIMFARINTLHSSILSKSDLKKMLEMLFILYDTEKVPKFKNFLSYYQIIHIKVSFHSNKIIFSIHMPLLNPLDFDYYHLYPVPQNNVTIISSKPYLIISSKIYQYEDNECPSIEDIFFCKNKLTFNEKDCIISFMQNLRADNCQFTSISSSTTITENFILIIPYTTTKIKKICENVSYKIIEHPSLIQIPKHCKIIHENTTFANEENTLKGEPFLLPKIKTEELPMRTKIPHLHINHINLNDIARLQKESIYHDNISLPKTTQHIIQYPHYL